VEQVIPTSETRRELVVDYGKLKFGFLQILRDPSGAMLLRDDNYSEAVTGYFCKEAQLKNNRNNRNNINNKKK
jgi:hypothetical protein